MTPIFAGFARVASIFRKSTTVIFYHYFFFIHIFQYQRKSVTLVDQYECTLSKELKDTAERDLRETEDLRNFSIQTMRDWALQNPRIDKIRLDSIWLLKYLRFTKYSIPKCQEAMERHLVLRQGSHGLKYFHKELDLMRPSVKRIFDTQ